MSDPANDRDARFAELETAAHAMRGIFAVLGWIDGGRLKGAFDDGGSKALDRVRGELTIAGELIAQRTVDNL